MRRMTAGWVCALACVLVAPPDAAAGGFRIGLNGGVATPIRAYKDNAERGFIGGADFDFPVSGTFALGLGGSFVSNRASDELEASLSASAGTPVRATLTMLQVGIHLKFMSDLPLESRLSPYVVLGLGIYGLGSKLESSNPAYNRDGSESKPGARAGLGLTYRIGDRVGIGTEGTFHYVSTKVTSIFGGEIRPSTEFIGIQAVMTIDLAAASP